MQIKETKSEGLTKTFDITIPADDVAKQMETELKTVGKNVKIPGFRPGHVPVKILKQRYGKNVEAEVVRALMNQASQKVIGEHKLRPAIAPKVDGGEYEEAKDLAFSITIEQMPEIPEIDFGSVQVDKPKVEVEDADINEALQRLAKNSPKLVPLSKGKKAEMGHALVIDFKGAIDSVPFDGGEAKDYSIELGSGQLIDTFEEQLAGTKAGDSKLVTVTFPENYQAADLAGKKATFDVTVKEISEITTPEIDDAFARSKEFADLRSLKEAIRDQLMKEGDRMARTFVKKELFDALDEKTEFPLPGGMVDIEFNAIWERLQQYKAQGELDTDKDEEGLREEYMDIARRRVKLGLVLAEIGHQNKLEVTQQELTSALMGRARQYPGQEQKVVDFYREHPERLEELRGPLIEEKAVDFILEKSKVKDKAMMFSELLEADPDAALSGRSKKEKSEKGKAKAKKPAAKKSDGKKTSDDDAAAQKKPAAKKAAKDDAKSDAKKSTTASKKSAKK